jgi:hypothetical protein
MDYNTRNQFLSFSRMIQRLPAKVDIQFPSEGEKGV